MPLLIPAVVWCFPWILTGFSRCFLLTGNLWSLPAVVWLITLMCFTCVTSPPLLYLNLLPQPCCLRLCDCLKCLPFVLVLKYPSAERRISDLILAGSAWFVVMSYFNCLIASSLSNLGNKLYIKGYIHHLNHWTVNLITKIKQTNSICHFVNYAEAFR